MEHSDDNRHYVEYCLYLGCYPSCLDILPSIPPVVLGIKEHKGAPF